ncbi:MAG: hypothetical protein ABI068_00820 [Ktedonobacterales bacterium]
MAWLANDHLQPAQAGFVARERPEARLQPLADNHTGVHRMPLHRWPWRR